MFKKINLTVWCICISMHLLYGQEPVQVTRIDTSAGSFSFTSIPVKEGWIKLPLDADYDTVIKPVAIVIGILPTVGIVDSMDSSVHVLIKFMPEFKNDSAKDKEITLSNVQRIMVSPTSDSVIVYFFAKKESIIMWRLLLYKHEDKFDGVLDYGFGLNVRNIFTGNPAEDF